MPWQHNLVFKEFKMNQLVEINELDLEEIFGGVSDQDYDDEAGDVVVVTGKRCTSDTDKEGCK